MRNSSIIEESITDFQKVKFIIDDLSSFKLLENVDYSSFQKGIVFCDKTLRDNWWPKLEKVLKNNIKIADVKYLDATEETKSIKFYGKLVNHLGNIKCSRDDLIIAIGGGTILDAVSFLASTYMRGIRLFMIPTTLIGQADASTAGKTCINTEYAKNVLGTFYLPQFVYNNISILKTNSEYDSRQGFSEVFKYGLLGSKPLIDLIIKYKQNPTDSLMISILSETIRVRIDIRKKDPLASNLGHTFGHALEKITNYAVNHGDAISVGIVMALEFSVFEGLVKPKFKNKVVDLMRTLGLNTMVSTGINPAILTNTMLTDKKSSNTLIRLVLINDFAKPLKIDKNYFYAVNPEKMLIFLTSFLVNKSYINKNHWNELRRK